MSTFFWRTLGLGLGFAFLLPVSRTQAGDVISLSGSPEVNGKISLTPSGIHVDGSFSPGDIALGSVLQASFSDIPFALDSFTVGPGASGLPLTWKTQEVGVGGTPGSIVCKNGEITLAGGGSGDTKATQASDRFFFAGQPWTGNGQWTLHIKQIGDQAPLTTAGIVLREGMEGDSPLVSLGVAAKLKGRELFGPQVVFRATSATGGRRGGGNVKPTPLQLPVWIRLTLNGLSAEAAYSTDGKEWDVAGQQIIKSWSGFWIGFFLDSHDPAVSGTAVFDQVSFTPGPSPSQVIPPGIVLTSGSFLAGAFNSPKPADGAEAKGALIRNGKSVPIPRANVAVVALHPLERSLITANSSQVGLLMKNGDFLAGDPDSIGSEITLNSLLLGLAKYTQAEVSGCLLRPAKPPSNAAYEVRLRDGSVIFANGLSVNKGLLGIDEVTGVTIDVAADDVAQFRAGPGIVQDLLDLPWKATALPAAGSPPTATGTDVTPSISCWAGNNQQEIMVLPGGTSADFPLPGKFRSLAVSIVMAPEAPANSQADIRVLVDGREVGRTPPFRAGDPPRFVQVTLPEPKTLTLVADTTSPAARVLIIDPVAVK